LKCNRCLVGDTFRCRNKAESYGDSAFDQGSMSTHAVWPENVLSHIPDSLDSAEAAPMMCAGATVFVPMLRHGVKKGDRVGIVGVGGLGHLAIQFAAKLGAEVVVFSHSESKKEEAINLGASEFWTDLKKVPADKGVDHLFVYTQKHPNWAE
jgi:D-arabinose 1-dehydrogenase-like Zn-dependent alcohol dehydrogenase